MTRKVTHMWRGRVAEGDQGRARTGRVEGESRGWRGRLEAVV